MKLARVEGVASPVRKVRGFEGHRVVIVSIVGDSPGGLIAAADPLQAAVGEYVLVTEGRAAAAALDVTGSGASRVDAAVVAVVRPEEVKPGLLD